MQFIYIKVVNLFQVLAILSPLVKRSTTAIAALFISPQITQIFTVKNIVLI